jgi:hypothetical protein
MTVWYEKPWAGWLIRLGGAVLIAGCALTIARLVALEHFVPAHQATPRELLLALIGVACGSGGGVMLFYGHHLFDRVMLSARWRHYSNIRDRDARKLKNR